MKHLLRPQAIDLYERMLDFSALRHRVLANNIANINTPGFRRSDVAFADELKRVLQEQGVEGVKQLRFQITKPNETAFRNDGNNVSIDTEMAALAENTIMYQVYTQLLSRRFRHLNKILNEV